MRRYLALLLVASMLQAEGGMHTRREGAGQLHHHHHHHHRRAGESRASCCFLGLAQGAEAEQWQAASGRSSRRMIVLRGGGEWGEHPSFDIADAMKKSEGEEDEKESVAMLMRRKEEQGRGRGGRGGGMGTAEGQGGALGEEVGDSNVSGMGDSDEEGGKELREVDQVRQKELEGEGSGRGGRREGAVKGNGGEGERGGGVEGGQVGGVDDDCEYYVIRSSSGEEIDTSCFFPSPSDPFPLQKFLVEKGMVRGKERGPKAWISGRREGLAARVEALLAKLDGGQHAAAAAAATTRNQSEVRGEGDGRGGGEEIKGGRIARGIEDIDAVESRLWREFKAAKEGRGGDAVAGAACPLASFLHNVKGDRSTAEEVCQSALDASPTHLDILCIYGDVLLGGGPGASWCPLPTKIPASSRNVGLRSSPEDIDVGMRIYSEAVANGGRGRAWCGLAKGMLLGGDADGAGALLLQATIEDKRCSHAWYGLAMSHIVGIGDRLLRDGRALPAGVSLSLAVKRVEEEAELEATRGGEDGDSSDDDDDYFYDDPVTDHDEEEEEEEEEEKKQGEVSGGRRRPGGKERVHQGGEGDETSPKGMHAASEREEFFGKLASAESSLITSIECDPSHVDSLTALGALLLMAYGQLDPAIRLWGHATSLGPWNVDVVRGYADLLIRGGRVGDAGRAWRRCVASRPSDASLLAEYAVFLWRTRGDVGGAEKVMRLAGETCATGNGRARALGLLGDLALFARGDCVRAEGLYIQAEGCLQRGHEEGGGQGRRRGGAWHACEKICCFNTMAAFCRIMSGHESGFPPSRAGYVGDCSAGRCPVVMMWHAQQLVDANQEDEMALLKLARADKGLNGCISGDAARVDALVCKALASMSLRGDYRSGMAWLRQAMNEQPNDSDALTAMGSIRSRLESDSKRHRTGGWRAYFESAAAVGGSSVLRRFALLLEEKGQWVEAVKVWARAKAVMEKEGRPASSVEEVVERSGRARERGEERERERGKEREIDREREKVRGRGIDRMMKRGGMDGGEGVWGDWEGIVMSEQEGGDDEEEEKGGGGGGKGKEGLENVRNEGGWSDYDDDDDDDVGAWRLPEEQKGGSIIEILDLGAGGGRGGGLSKSSMHTMEVSHLPKEKVEDVGQGSKQGRDERGGGGDRGGEDLEVSVLSALSTLVSGGGGGGGSGGTREQIIALMRAKHERDMTERVAMGESEVDSFDESDAARVSAGGFSRRGVPSSERKRQEQVAARRGRDGGVDVVLKRPEAPRSMYEVQRDARVQRNKEALKRAGEGLVGADDALKRVRDQEKEEGWSGLMSEDE